MGSRTTLGSHFPICKMGELVSQRVYGKMPEAGTLPNHMENSVWG